MKQSKWFKGEIVDTPLPISFMSGGTGEAEPPQFSIKKELWVEGRYWATLFPWYQQGPAGSELTCTAGDNEMVWVRALFKEHVNETEAGTDNISHPSTKRQRESELHFFQGRTKQSPVRSKTYTSNQVFMLQLNNGTAYLKRKWNRSNCSEI